MVDIIKSGLCLLGYGTLKSVVSQKWFEELNELIFCTVIVIKSFLVRLLMKLCILNCWMPGVLCRCTGSYNHWEVFSKITSKMQKKVFSFSSLKNTYFREHLGFNRMLNLCWPAYLLKMLLFRRCFSHILLVQINFLVTP